MSDPQIVLEEFFEVYSLTDMRACLKQLLYDALTVSAADGKAHLAVYEDVEKLIEAVWLIFSAHQSRAEVDKVN